ncbi:MULTISPECIES: hypothetical protein [Burkholderia cepacia complex]|uniref:hypothetical protein n=1 Tax=Burkholderia cepacia complex TaxID=87882 RepID=UPI000F07EA49|nr:MULTISPECIES: hypothetical protein [Burkholderia cepacia complex]AYQ40166.1 hypothetical protein CVS37_13640 [Burkholderia lata]MDN8071298.1 hypothetical protein [Burkholderia vietnamiensis]
MQERDYELAAKLSRAGDDMLVGPVEVAALTGLSPITIGKRKVTSMPEPVPGIRRLLWRMGDVRQWMRRRSGIDESAAEARPGRRGRPTKAEEVSRRMSAQ